MKATSKKKPREVTPSECVICTRFGKRFAHFPHKHMRRIAFSDALKLEQAVLSSELDFKTRAAGERDGD